MNGLVFGRGRWEDLDIFSSVCEQRRGVGFRCVIGACLSDWWGFLEERKAASR